MFERNEFQLTLSIRCSFTSSYLAYADVNTDDFSEFCSIQNVFEQDKFIEVAVTYCSI